MTFKQIYYRVFLRKEQVKNVPNSPSYQGSLIQDWESYKGRIALKCARCGKDLMQDDKVGAMFLRYLESQLTIMLFLYAKYVIIQA